MKSAISIAYSAACIAVLIAWLLTPSLRTVPITVGMVVANVAGAVVNLRWQRQRLSSRRRRSSNPYPPAR